MPWSNQGGGGGGGGPWGGEPQGGGQNPWGRGGPNQADIEDMIRRGQDRFRQVMPKGFGGGRGLLVAIVVIVIGWLLTGIYRVQPDEKAVVQRFGAYVRTEGDGLQYHWPAPIESVTKLSVTSQNRIEIGFTSVGGSNRDVSDESQMLTKDENVIEVSFVVLWQISDPVAFHFNTKDPTTTVKAAAQSAMREVIGQTEVQSALYELQAPQTGDASASDSQRAGARIRIEQETLKLLQATLDNYGTSDRPGIGVTVNQVQLLQATAPQPVIDAFYDVQRASQERVNLRNQATAYRNDILPRARGDAARVLQDAEGYRQEVLARAQGDASRFTSILQSYRAAPEITAERLYLETIENVMKGANKIFLDEGAGAQGVVPYLPLNELMKPLVPDPTTKGGR